MDIIVASDTHGERSLVEAWKAIQGDVHIHCGDSELAADDSIWKDVYVVKGNCDVGSYVNEKIVHVANTSILVVHGHRDRVKQSMLPLSYKAQAEDVQIVCFGHSHLYGAEYVDGVLFVNPGSLAQPRGGRLPTYAWITVEKTSYTVQFKTLQGTIVDSVTFKK